MKDIGPFHYYVSRYEAHPKLKGEEPAIRSDRERPSFEGRNNRIRPLNSRVQKLEGLTWMSLRLDGLESGIGRVSVRANLW